MQIEKHRVVSIDYELTDSDGQVIDSSSGSEPLAYLHGVGGIIPGLESALEGKTSGEQLKVSIEPADAYGERQDELQQVVTRDQFGENAELEVGMRFRVPREQGGELVVTIVDLNDENVTVDGNHPLAGETLHFDVTVRDVREATEEEIEHGHAHHPDGSHESH